jgi:uncharacterized protein (TIGR02058 family)
MKLHACLVFKSVPNNALYYLQVLGTILMVNLPPRLLVSAEEATTVTILFYVRPALTINSINYAFVPTVRACRNAIEFNSIPSINKLVPGGYDALKLDVLLAVPPKYQSTLDLEKVKDVFPYGATKFTIQDGGMVAPSGIAIDSLGDTNDDMVVVCASVTVGY